MVASDLLTFMRKGHNNIYTILVGKYYNISICWFCVFEKNLREPLYMRNQYLEHGKLITQHIILRMSVSFISKIYGSFTLVALFNNSTIWLKENPNYVNLFAYCGRMCYYILCIRWCDHVSVENVPVIDIYKILLKIHLLAFCQNCMIPFLVPSKSLSKLSGIINYFDRKWIAYIISN